MLKCSNKRKEIAIDILPINERNELEVLLKENYKISKILNRHRATIYCEIRRINGEYSFENAQSNDNKTY